MKFENLIQIEPGSPPSRLETPEGHEYGVYSQNHLEADLSGIYSEVVEEKTLKSDLQVPTLEAEDVIINLITGQASRVSRQFSGYFYSHNFVKLTPNAELDANYLVYLLNEDKEIKKQIFQNVQGSQVVKYTVQLLRGLELRQLPNLKTQELIGQLYRDRLTLNALRERREQLSMQLFLKQIERGKTHESSTSK